MCDIYKPPQFSFFLSFAVRFWTDILKSWRTESIRYILKPNRTAQISVVRSVFSVVPEIYSPLVKPNRCVETDMRKVKNSSSWIELGF